MNWKFIFSLLLIQIQLPACAQQLLENLCRNHNHVVGEADSVCVSAFRWSNPEYEAILEQIDSLENLIDVYFLQPGNGSLTDEKRLITQKLEELNQLIRYAESPDSFGILNDRPPTTVRTLPRIHLNPIQLDSLFSYRNINQADVNYTRIHSHKTVSESIPNSAIWDHWKLELGVGFTQFFVRPSQYFVNRQGGIDIVPGNGGFQLLLSAHCTYVIKPSDAVFISLPIATLSGQADHTLGLLGKSLATGIGYQRSLGNVSAYVAILTAPFEHWEEELLATVHLDEKPYAVADLSDYPSSTRYHLVGSFGLSFPLYAP